MHLRLRYLFAAGALTAILTAPTAAANDQVCTSSGSSTECVSPGNAEIDAAPPAVSNDQSVGVYPGPYQVPWDEGSR